MRYTSFCAEVRRVANMSSSFAPALREGLREAYDSRPRDSLEAEREYAGIMGRVITLGESYLAGLVQRVKEELGKRSS